MEIKFFTLVLYSIILGLASSQDVATPSHTGSGLLQQAIRYLVNYTAAEATAYMDMYNLGSTVAAIAYEKLTEKLGRHICNTSTNIEIKNAPPIRYLIFLLCSFLLSTQFIHTQGIVMIIKD